MKTVVMFDPSIRTLNMGDHIIVNSIENEMEELLEDNFVIHCATHAPAVTFYQNFNSNPSMKIYNNTKLKFICGSNLLWKNMLVPKPSLNINLWNCNVYKNSVLLGVGNKNNAKKLNWYTGKLYKKILSKEFIHSVRDEETKRMVESLGLKAINTGCPTMWKFTEEFCKEIPTNKCDKVVFTLTDYGIDREKDQILIDILKRNYKEVYFWVQGISDKEYFESLNNIENIKMIPPTVEAYSKVLKQDSIDYVGTRLHAGMFSLQHKRRTIIISIDNRVRDMKETYGLVTIERNEIEGLEKLINSSFITKIKINEENIKTWKNQFLGK